MDGTQVFQSGGGHPLPELGNGLGGIFDFNNQLVIPLVGQIDHDRFLRPFYVPKDPLPLLVVSSSDNHLDPCFLTLTICVIILTRRRKHNTQLSGLPAG